MVQLAGTEASYLLSRFWWLRLFLPPLGGQRQVDGGMFQASLSFLGRPCLKKVCRLGSNGPKPEVLTMQGLGREAQHEHGL